MPLNALSTNLHPIHKQEENANKKENEVERDLVIVIPGVKSIQNGMQILGSVLVPISFLNQSKHKKLASAKILSAFHDNYKSIRNKLKKYIISGVQKFNIKSISIIGYLFISF